MYYDVVTYVVTCFVQIFLIKMLGGVALGQVEFKEVIVVEVMVRGNKKRKKSHLYMPRAWRWAGVKQGGNNLLVSVIDEEGPLFRW